MFDKMKQLMDLQKKAKEMQKGLESIRVEKKTQDGRISIVLNGNHRLESVRIDDSLWTPAQKPAVEKALADLVTEAADEIKEKSAAQAMDMMKGFNIPGM